MRYYDSSWHRSFRVFREPIVRYERNTNTYIVFGSIGKLPYTSLVMYRVIRYYTIQRFPKIPVKHIINTSLVFSLENQPITNIFFSILKTYRLKMNK